jgi:hypothetical protein
MMTSLKLLPIAERKCATCAAFEENPAMNDDDGTCHRDPPQQNGHQRSRPAVRPDNWCLSWRDARLGVGNPEDYDD